MAKPWEAYQSQEGPWVAYQTSAAPKSPAEKVDPTEGMSWGDKFLAGAGKGMTDTYRGAKQLFGIGDQKALQAEIDEAKRLDAPLMETGGGITGNIAGALAATALPGGVAAKGAMAVPKIAALVEALTAARPVATAMGLGAGTGAAQGALEPVATGESRGKNVALSGIIGAAGGAIPGVLSKVVGGAKITPEAQALIDEGVRVTPGQALGGGAKRAEDAMTSYIGVGDMIKSAQTRGLEDFNRAGFNRALAPIGEKVGPGFNIGREGVAEVESKIGAAYDRALDRIKIVQLDQQFADEAGKVLGMAAELGEGPARQLGVILKNRVFDKMTEAGTMSAETMKEVESVLGREASKWRGSADPAQRGLGDALREVQASLRGAVERTAGPDAAQELRNANQAWANFVRIQDAAGRIGSREGVFTPAQLLGAVRNQDKSVRKGAFARGDALMQDLAESGKSVLPSSVPDSGTATRLGALVQLLNPKVLAASGLGSLAYTNAGQAVTLAALAKRPEVARELARILEAGAPAGGFASGLLAPSLTGP